MHRMPMTNATWITNSLINFFTSSPPKTCLSPRLLARCRNPRTSYQTLHGIGGNHNANQPSLDPLKSSDRRKHVSCFSLTRLHCRINTLTQNYSCKVKKGGNPNLFVHRSPPPVSPLNPFSILSPKDPPYPIEGVREEIGFTPAVQDHHANGFTFYPRLDDSTSRTDCSGSAP